MAQPVVFHVGRRQPTISHISGAVPWESSPTSGEDVNPVSSYFVDHEAVINGTDWPATLSFTVPDSAAAELHGQIPARANHRVETDSIGGAGYRFYILESRDSNVNSGVVLAVVGVSHQRPTDAVAGAERL